MMSRSLWKNLWWVCQVFAAVRRCYTESRELKNYAKVDPRFPNDLGICFLESFTNCKKLYQCGNLCSENHECHLFCIEGNECQLYKARVARHWEGIVSDPVPSKECFSSWGRSNDAIPSATVSSVVLPANRVVVVGPHLAVNGYVCNANDGYMYHSEWGDRPWWAADLGTIRKITSVRIFTRPNDPTQFEDVEIRVGTSNPGNGDFTANALFAFYKGPAPYATTLIFESSQQMKGSVVSIQTLNSWSILCFSDIQIVFS